ncbi:unnamed protein product [Spirodela intermedia]|uniref:Polycomb protein VEFS-Box domain-containing protein n=1 Tax=Spirodela intermedia TaxID=51605 RepID=A0A7I8IGS5_SPIIN|nr:unnamed protein product [Spirodela intermedia]CAA6656494.1 unnamed protein product [Spirodela intermedia]
MGILNPFPMVATPNSPDIRVKFTGRTLLQKRQFFHSHRAQPMALEQVLSDRDSEDEVDDDIADFEDRRMLDDFVDVTKDEKRIMHLWNSFVRRQRVLADGHIPWACEAFTKLHGPDFVREPALIWCWRLFMIKLWNHSLLDARSMNSCNLLLEKYQSEGTSTPMSTPDHFLYLLYLVSRLFPFYMTQLRPPPLCRRQRRGRKDGGGSACGFDEDSRAR